ncbi:MAG: DnaA/Hda family protein, partial [bacterium]|nr:DnaA/Hda family protein [bacterium]
AGKQIVIACDRPPKAIPNITDRLTSRFESGLKVDIQPPDIETRQAIIAKKAEVEKIYVPRDVIYFIAENINTNIRELEGALITVIASASFQNGGVVDLAVAQSALKDVIAGKNDKKFAVEEIQKCTAKYFCIDIADLKSAKRDQKYSVPRHIAMYLTREQTDLSYKDIAKAFNKNDHTTIKHAYEKVKASIASSDDTKSNIRNILDMLKG